MVNIEARQLMASRLIWPIAVLAALLLFNFFFTPGFFAVEIRDGRVYGSLVDILDRCAPIMLISLGMTLVIATGGVDLSVGAVMAIAGTVTAGIIVQPDYSVLSKLPIPPAFAAAIAAALVAGIIAGLANGVFVAYLKIQPIVATLILMVAGRGIAQLLAKGQIITFQDPTLSWLGNGAFLGLPVSLTVVAIAYLIAGLVTRRTAFGLFVESVGDNATASQYAGIPINQIKLLVYTVSGFCAGMAGILVAADVTAADANRAGLYSELDAILAVVLGGTALSGGRFSLVGTIIGALLIQALTTTILTRGDDIERTLIVKAIVIVLVCLLQAGVLGKSLAFLRQRRRPA